MRTLRLLAVALTLAGAAVTDAGTAKTAAMIDIESAEILARIDRSTGMMVGLTSKLPVPLEVLPAGEGMCLYLKLAGGDGRRVLLDRARKVTRAGKKLLSVTATPSSPRDADLAEALLEYRFAKDALTIRAEVRLQRAAGQVTEIGLGQGYSPAGWDNHWYCNLYFNKKFALSEPSEPTTPRFFQFDQSVSDETFLPDWNDWLQMPLGIVERGDRYMLWGSLDLGRFCVLAPNKEGLLPSFLYRPNKQAGRTFIFETFIKFASKSDTDFTTAYRWYARNVYSTNPLTKGIVTMPEYYKPHTVSPGSIGCLNTYMSEWGEAGSVDGAWKVWEDAMVAGKMVHQWFGELQTFDGRLPTSGSWWAPYANRELSAEQLKSWIERLHGRGLKVYLYNRQLFGNHRMYDGSPPFREWMKKDRLGNYMPYPCGNLQDYERGWHDLSAADAARLKVDKEKLRALFGSDKVGWLYADFDNAKFRSWYIEAVKDQIEYFDADGVAWDMAWFDIHRGIHHGILRVQYEIYQWLKQKHPEKRVLANMAHGNPSSLYTDMVFMEGPPWSTQERAVQAGHAYMLPLNVPLDYADWGLNISEGMKCPSLGLTCFTTHALRDRLDGVPKLIKVLGWLFDFSARANSMTLLTDFGAVQVDAPGGDVKASAWEAKDAVLVAAYRAATPDASAGQAEVVRVRIDRKHLASGGAPVAGEMTFTLVNPDGVPAGAPEFRCEKIGANLVITGELLPGHLVLCESP